MKFIDAVLTRNARACARFVDIIRHRHGGTYGQIFATVQRIDPTMTLVDWDALIEEGEVADEGLVHQGRTTEGQDTERSAPV